MKEVEETMKKLVGGVEIEYNEERPSDFEGKIVLAEKAKKELGWEPKVDFEEVQSKFNISVITHPFSDLAGQTILANLIDVLLPISEHIYVISGDFSYESNKIHIFRNGAITTGEPFLLWISKQVQAQLKSTYYLIKISKKIDIALFFLGGRVLLLPFLVAKILGKKVVVAATGSASGTTKGVYSNRPFRVGGLISKIASVLERACFLLSDQVAVESEGSISFLGLNKYRKKISITGAVYIDTDNFKMKKDLKDKRNLIGYIGRLSTEKGVLSFVKAIPLILKERNDLEFLIGGNGPLFDEITNELKNNGSYNKVELTGWISHDELPKYLNELKVIVAPSYSEGGVPAVIMEAMACGTVSLVTPVAGVDVIKDGESGFILEDNSPECIAKNVIRVLAHPNLDEIVNNACNLVEEEFSYETEVMRYRDMLYRVLYDQK